VHAHTYTQTHTTEHYSALKAENPTMCNNMSDLLDMKLREISLTQKDKHHLTFLKDGI
jgi:hypothetical protein